VGTVLFLVLGAVAAVVAFVWLAMDAGRYSWATALIGRSVDALVRGIRSLTGRT